MARAILIIILFWHQVEAAEANNGAVEVATPETIQTLNDFHGRSSAFQPYFIELFTSQGCSSCPPADSWLSEFKQEAGLWQKYFPIAFHVTYWDYIGWQDPFGDRRYSQRQYDHLNQLNIRQVYTPQFVVNGKEWRGWFNRSLGNTFQQMRNSVGAMQVDILDSQLVVDFIPSAGIEGQVVTVHIALLGADLMTAVSKGENRNKSLKHDFTVLAHQYFIPQKLSKKYQVTAQLDESFLFAFSQHSTSKNNNRMALVSWVEVNKQPKQAVGGWVK